MRFHHVLLILAALGAKAADPLPSADDVMRRFMERANAIAQTNAATLYVYDKRSITQELDASDKPVKTTEKLYTVRLVGGVPFQRLAKIQGRDLTPRELERENQRELAFRQRLSGVDLKKKSQQREAVVTKDLIDRFEFRVTKREQVRERNVLALAFKPKPGQPEKNFQDKLLNRFTGTLWVDEQEYELTKLDATMAGPVSIGWLGVAGALERCHLTMERLRLPDGMWANASSSFMIAGRKLLSAMRVKAVEESSNFHIEPAR